MIADEPDIEYVTRDGHSYYESGVVKGVRFRLNEAWGRVALNVREEWGVDPGSSEVFLSADDLTALAAKAVEYAERLRCRASCAVAVQPVHGRWVVDLGNGEYDIRQFACESEAREYAAELNRSSPVEQ